MSLFAIVGPRDKNPGEGVETVIPKQPYTMVPGHKSHKKKSSLFFRTSCYYFWIQECCLLANSTSQQDSTCSMGTPVFIARSFSCRPCDHCFQASKGAMAVAGPCPLSMCLCVCVVSKKVPQRTFDVRGLVGFVDHFV